MAYKHPKDEEVKAEVQKSSQNLTAEQRREAERTTPLAQNRENTNDLNNDITNNRR